MNKNITLRIDRHGSALGTVGWLSENASEIRIGRTTDGQQAAWLYNHVGQQMTVLAVRDDKNGYGLIGVGRLLADDYDAAHPLLMDHPVSDACWASLSSIVEATLEIMETEYSAGTPVCYSLSKSQNNC